MKNIVQFINEKFRLSKDCLKGIVEKDKLKINVEDEIFYNSIGKDMPIDDYARTGNEAIEMIKNSDDTDRFYFLRKIEQGIYRAVPTYYWVRYVQGNFILMDHQTNAKVGSEYIKTTLDKDHLMLAKVEYEEHSTIHK